VVCGITTTAPGSPPKRAAVEHAFTEALDLLNTTSARSLTIPEIGIRVPGIEFSDAAGILALILSARIRQGTRLHEVVIAGLHHEYLRQCHALLIRAGATAE
ncbi:MAG TPA: hypothetical protein VMM78_17515, partial [Thermomicrobiales bacterium]|nr:hypothetical protein [Thermomicrobiales bacterium]